MKVLARNKIPMSVVSGDSIHLMYHNKEVAKYLITQTYAFEEAMVLESEDGELLPDAGRALIGAFVEKKQ